METRFELKGMDEVTRALKDLPSKLAKDAAMKAVVSSVQPLIVEAKRNAQKHNRTGSLKISIGFRVKKYRRGNRTFGIVGARRGMGVGKNEPANYAHLLEYGHAIKTKDGIKTVQARPFMRPAWERTKNETLKQLTGVFKNEVQMEIAKLASRKARHKGISKI